MPPPANPPLYLVSMYNVGVMIIGAGILALLGWLGKQGKDNLKLLHEMRSTPREIAAAKEEIKAHNEQDDKRFAELSVSNAELKNITASLDKKQDAQTVKLDHITSQTDKLEGAVQEIRGWMHAMLRREHPQQGD